MNDTERGPDDLVAIAENTIRDYWMNPERGHWSVAGEAEAVLAAIEPHIQQRERAAVVSALEELAWLEGNPSDGLVVVLRWGTGAEPNELTLSQWLGNRAREFDAATTDTAKEAI